MQKFVGTPNRILEIDLNLQTSRIFEITAQERKLYLGGKGLALSLLAERLVPGTDALSPDNVLIIMTGPLTGTGAPSSSRFAAVAKSPLTDLIVTSTCGGSFGNALKTAGYEGLILRGKLAELSVLTIDSQTMKIEPSPHLLRLTIPQTQKHFAIGKNDGSLVIGPAGENGVSYANIASGDRFLGRGGLGAVMGSKNLKAVVVFGNTYEYLPVYEKEFLKAKKLAIKYINRNHTTGDDYRFFGTASNLKYTNKEGILPVRNFADGTHPKAGQISGEEYARLFQTKPDACQRCVILCGHKGTLDGEKVHIPEYETIGMFGSNLEVFDPQAIIEWNDLCGELGIDTISAASTIAFAMEATEKGLMESDLKFGCIKSVTDMLYDISDRKGIGDWLANGSRWLSLKIGGTEFANHVKGMELPAYDPRGAWGQGLAYAVANRGGCHLSATIFPLENFFHLLKPHTMRAKAEFVVFFENLYAAVNSIPTCLFTSFAYVLEPPLVHYTWDRLLALVMQFVPRLALKLMDISIFPNLYSNMSGYPLSSREFMQAGERIHVLERYLNTLEGVDREQDILPDRFLKEGRKSDPEQKVVPLRPMLEKYYRLRGYDANGIPLPSLLKKLSILKE